MVLSSSVLPGGAQPPPPAAFLDELALQVELASLARRLLAAVRPHLLAAGVLAPSLSAALLHHLQVLPWPQPSSASCFNNRSHTERIEKQSLLSRPILNLNLDVLLNPRDN